MGRIQEIQFKVKSINQDQYSKVLQDHVMVNVPDYVLQLVMICVPNLVLQHVLVDVVMDVHLLVEMFVLVVLPYAIHLAELNVKTLLDILV